MKKWCEHIRYDKDFGGQWNMYASKPDNYKLTQVCVAGNWNFCPICGAPRPKDQK